MKKLKTLNTYKIYRYYALFNNKKFIINTVQYRFFFNIKKYKKYYQNKIHQFLWILEIGPTL